MVQTTVIDGQIRGEARPGEREVIPAPRMTHYGRVNHERLRLRWASFRLRLRVGLGRNGRDGGLLGNLRTQAPAPAQAQARALRLPGCGSGVRVRLQVAGSGSGLSLCLGFGFPRLVPLLAAASGSGFRGWFRFWCGVGLWLGFRGLLCLGC